MGKGVFDLDEESGSDREDEAPVLLQRKGRKMDELLNQLRKKHDGGTRAGVAADDCDGLGDADERTEFIPSSGVHDASTNLVLKPLPQNVDEHVLLAEFGRFGEIGSIKIIWPRGDRPVGTGNTGFVAFMRREDAETAMRKMGGIKFHGNMLSINIGDPVPLPSVPLNPAGFKTLANPAATRERLEDGPAPKAITLGVGPDVVVALPDTAKRRYIIDATAFYVARDGYEFEDLIRKKQANNADFAFLFDDKSPAEHVYYRWRVWSLCNGDSLKSWRVEPFLMTMNGPLWIPPPTEHVTLNAASVEVAPGEKSLDDASRDRMQHLLQNLSNDRDSIKTAMMFAIQNAECCREVSNALLHSVQSADDGDVQKKLWVLYLASDILFNTTSRMPNASLYRASLQKLVPHLVGSILSSPNVATSRLGKAAVVGKIKGLVSAWREWHAIDDDVLSAISSNL